MCTHILICMKKFKSFDSISNGHGSMNAYTMSLLTNILFFSFFLSIVTSSSNINIVNVLDLVDTDNFPFQVSKFKFATIINKFM